MHLVRCQCHHVVQHIGGFDADHALPAVGCHVGEFAGFFDPRVPQDGRFRAGAADVNAALPFGVNDAEHAGCVFVDAVGFAGEGQIACLFALLPVFQGVDVGQAVEPFDVDLAHVADGEVGVQRLAEGDWLGTAVVADQTYIQCMVEANAQLQGDSVWPAGQMAFGLRQDEFHQQRIAIFTDTEQFPIQRLAAVVGKLFFPVDMPDWLRMMQTFGIFAAGYLARPLGGIIMAHFGDLLGRKKMFTLSIFMMAVPTLIMGLLPTYAQIGLWAPILLLLMRVIQGAAIGGEVPGAWVFVSEHVPARRVGYACGTLTAGLTAGILLGSLVATAINSIYTPVEVSDYAWRIPFLLGGVFGLMSVYLRRLLHETPVFAELQAAQGAGRRSPAQSGVA